MLNGRRASFACSEVETPDLSTAESRNWQWSADLGHHVLVTPDAIEVRSGRQVGPARRFQRPSVENSLEEFVTFLERPPQGALPDIVPFLLNEFLQLWASMAPTHADGHVALAVFLIALEAVGEADSGVLEDPTWRTARAHNLNLDDGIIASLSHLDADVTGHALGMQKRAPLGLQLIPSLILRHAAGRLFQEAHASLESFQQGLFPGTASVTLLPTFSPRGAYITPISMARLLAEAALQRPGLQIPSELTIADFACGSGVFLTEALRVLERQDFGGAVRLVGRDISPEAVTMTRVAIATVQRDLSSMTVSTDVCVGDALGADWPEADVILMNPPFRSWEQMTGDQREWVRSLVGEPRSNRADLSIGFIERALQRLRPHGVLGTLLPAGVLASEGLRKWRARLLDRTTPRLVAVLGEHGLFRHALVNVGMLLLENQLPTPESRLDIAWASAESGAASHAMCALRRTIHGVVKSYVDDPTWKVTHTSLGTWRTRPFWIPGAGALGPLLDRIQSATPATVEHIFDVHQGIRTGAKDIFILPARAVEQLPRSEREYFVPAVAAASNFVAGKIETSDYLFKPDPQWTASDLEHKVPRYYERYLNPNRDVLKKRAGIKPSRWWELTWSRPRAFTKHPRLISKRFGLYPAFACDFDARFGVVQGNVWAPTGAITKGRDDGEVRAILTAYWWLLNSRVAVAVLREYCPNVAGGQLDLERKYVRHVPMPDLSLRFAEDPRLQIMGNEMRSKYRDELPSLEERDRFAAVSFSTDLSEWSLAGLTSAGG